MLTPADEQLVSRDLAVPGLALVLDEDALAGRLHELAPHVELKHLNAVYVRYKPKTSCLVCYKASVGGNETDLYAKAYAQTASRKLEKIGSNTRKSMTFGCSDFLLEDSAVVVHFFPNDRKLAALGHLVDKKIRQKFLRKLLPERPVFWEAAVRNLHYKPERRYVGKLVGESGERAVLKMYAEDEYAPAEHGARSVKSRRGLRVARRIASSRRHRILVFEWIKGEFLHNAFGAPDFNPLRLRQVGAALAEVHAQEGGRLGEQSREAEAVGIMAAAEACAAVCPDCAGQMRAFALRLAGELLRLPSERCAIHGDFSADQILLRNGTIAILDFDSAALGDPAADLGSFIARLEWYELKEGITGEKKQAFASALIDGYRAASHLDPFARIRLYTAAGLIRLAPHAFRSREQNWLQLTLRTFRRAMEIADNE